MTDTEHHYAARWRGPVAAQTSGVLERVFQDPGGKPGRPTFRAGTQQCAVCTVKPGRV